MVSRVLVVEIDVPIDVNRSGDVAGAVQQDVREAFGERGALVYGWVFDLHRVGAAIAAISAGVVRDATGEHTIAWFAAAGLCAVAAVVSASIRPAPKPAGRHPHGCGV